MPEVAGQLGASTSKRRVGETHIFSGTANLVRRAGYLPVPPRTKGFQNLKTAPKNATRPLFSLNKPEN
jgi:hypothetical protein